MVWFRKLATKARALSKLGWRDALLLTEAWLTLAWIDLVISFCPYKWWRRWLQTEKKKGAVNENSERQILPLIRLAEAAARNHLRPMNCLRRTFAEQRMLRRRHIPSRVHIGVRMAESGLEAHAWLSLQGKIVNDSPDVGERYAELQAKEWDRLSSDLLFSRKMH